MSNDYYAHLAKLKKEFAAKQNPGQPKVRTKRENPERDLQIAVVQYFRWALPDVLFFHPANERATSLAYGALLKKMGVLAGVPDLLLFWKRVQMDNNMGVEYEAPIRAALELKSSAGNLSVKQREFQLKWLNSGGLYALCRTMQEVEQAVKSWGLQPKYPAPRLIKNAGKYMRQSAMFEFQKPL